MAHPVLERPQPTWPGALMSGYLELAAHWLVEHNLQMPLFALLIFVAFAEAAVFLGFVLPGETSLLIGGMLAAQGVWDLGDFFGAAIAAAIIGDSVGYELGKAYGDRIRGSWVGQRIGQRRWNVAQHMFGRYGGRAVFFGRAQALLRALVPALAGMQAMPYRRFLPWNAAGAVVWGGGVVILGYAFSNSLSALESALQWWAVVFVIAAGFGVWQVHRQVDAVVDRIEEAG